MSLEGSCSCSEGFYQSALTDMPCLRESDCMVCSACDNSCKACSMSNSN